jgi:hypothetical protein
MLSRNTTLDFPVKPNRAASRLKVRAGIAAMKDSALVRAYRFIVQPNGLSAMAGLLRRPTAAKVDCH